MYSENFITKVLIIEDDEDWAKIIYKQLTSIEGYECVGIADTYDTAKTMLRDLEPDALICDIVFENKVLIFDFLIENEVENLPIIFTSAFIDETFLENSKKFNFSLLIIKPFHFLTLSSALQTIIDKKEISQREKVKNENFLSVRGRQNIKKQLSFDLIHYINVEGNYCFIYSEHGKYALKISLAKMLATLSEEFIQVHKNYIINVNKIDKVLIQEAMVFMDSDPQTIIPVGKRYHKYLLNYLSTQP